jgi:hypothetical protein
MKNEDALAIKEMCQHFNKYYRKSCTYQQCIEYLLKRDMDEHPALKAISAAEVFEPFKEKMRLRSEDKYRKLTILILVSICKKYLTPKVANKDIVAIIAKNLLPEGSWT